MYKFMKNKLFSSLFIITSFINLAVADVDTSEYGEWQDVLTESQAVGRFDWLQRCYPGVLVELWDQMYDATAIKPSDEKISELRNTWLYNADGTLKSRPNYPTFGNKHHRNPKNWFAENTANVSCKTIPVDYAVIGLMTSMDYQPYCRAASTDASFEYIQSVQVGDSFLNNSGPSTYSNYLGRVVKVSTGNSYDLTLSPGFAGEAFEEYWHVFVDWNADGDFDDSGEWIYNGSGSDEVTATLTVPKNANPGLTKMRISMDFAGGSRDACRNIQYGEVEDYAIKIY